MQPFLDWEIVEDKDVGHFKYFIMKIKKPSEDYAYRGFLSYPGSPTDEWFENIDLNTLRMTMYVMANQNR